jgi:hypothetical protein
MILKHGKFDEFGETDSIIKRYLNNRNLILGLEGYTQIMNSSSKKIKGGIQSVQVYSDGKRSNTIKSGGKIEFVFEVNNYFELIEPVLGFVIKNEKEEPIIGVNNRHTNDKILHKSIGYGQIKITIDKFPLYGIGKFNVDIYYGDSESNFDTILDAFSFELETSDFYRSRKLLDPKLNRILIDKISFT